jgi:hypothetical protein
MVPLEGLEPPLLSEADFESAASTIPPQGHFHTCFAKVADFCDKKHVRFILVHVRPDGSNMNWAL